MAIGQAIQPVFDNQITPGL